MFIQAFINMLANRGTVLVRGCVGYHFDGLLSQLLWWVHTIAEVCNFTKVGYLGCVTVPQKGDLDILVI